MLRARDAIVLFGLLPCAPLAGLALVTGACGGETFGSGDGGGTTRDGGGGGQGDGGGGGPACPAIVPASGAPCAAPDLVCEYGPNPVQDCNTIATCTNVGWERTGPGPGLDCRPGSTGTCPASFASVPRGTHCSPLGVYCDYPSGRCACSVPSFGAQPLDASAEAIWICQDPSTAGCPTPRPLLGSACSQEGLQCDYGTCNTIPGGTAEACMGGVWVEAFVACPALAGGG